MPVRQGRRPFLYVNGGNRRDGRLHLYAGNRDNGLMVVVQCYGMYIAHELVTPHYHVAL